MQNLPTGTSTLAKVRNNNLVYVDKTAMVAQLTARPGAFFLSRPRRFGKSTLVDTFKELFEGNRALFQGLAIEPLWEWSRTFPVIKIDFAGGVIQSRAELDKRIYNLLLDNQNRLAIHCDWNQHDLAGCLTHLIHTAAERYGQRAVILIDEYDKPILDNIEHPERAAEIREGLKNLYSVLKERDADIQFAFMTGVTKFSKVSLFSGLNHLLDISLMPAYATLCGFTQHDLETHFAEHLAGVDWAKLKLWYNGYNFRGEAVYNPYDILLFIANGGEYSDYWFQTGTPSFLVKLFRQQRYFLPALEVIEVGSELMNSFEIERIHPITLLFQGGYLTLDRINEVGDERTYQLRVPNCEVRVALNNQFIDGYTYLEEERLSYRRELIQALTTANCDQLFATIRRLFAGIPWRNFTHNDLPEAEGYYASVLYAFFASLNATITPEDITQQGQADLTIQLAGFTYVMEIKLNHAKRPPSQGKPNAALKQILARGYCEKYRGSGQGLFAVGMVFNSLQRQLVQADAVPIV